MISRFFLPLFIAFFLFSCKNERILFVPAGEMEIPFTNDEFYYFEGRYYVKGDKEYWTYLDSITKELKFKNIHTNETEYIVSMDKMDSLRPGGVKYPILNYYVHTPDSVFVLLRGYNSIWLVGSRGNIINKWAVDTELENHNKEYVLQAPYEIPLCYKNGKIYVRVVRIDLHIGSAENRKIIFSSPPEVTIDIKQTPARLTNKTGQWPAMYRTDKFYYDYMPNRCIDSKERLVYAFRHDQNLYVYENDSLIKTIAAKSVFFTKTGFATYEGSTSDLKSLERYYVTQPYYGRVIYDPYRNLYYRLFHHGVEKYENEDGQTVKNMIDKPWSVIVLDETFRIINEIRFEQPYNSYFFMITEKGILINKREDNHPGSKMKFTLFKIVKE